VGDREVGLLICNAGGDPNGKLFLDVLLWWWLELIQRNVVTTLAACHHFGVPMRARKRGGILLVNSGACYGSAATMAPYSGSKAFMLGFAEGLWADLRPHGVDVLTLVLGQTDTPEFRRFMADKGMPFPENVARADDVARPRMERLPHGPIQNVGQVDDQPGTSPQLAAERRARGRDQPDHRTALRDRPLIDAAIVALADRATITDLICRYCRSVDRLDMPLGHSIWHEDGWADYGADVYQGAGKGVIDLICTQHRHTLHHSHQVSNILIALDGDRAGSEAYCTASLRIEREGVLRRMTIWNRYVDRWELRAGRWGLVRRDTIRDFDEVREVTEVQRHDRGRRDETDASCEVLGRYTYDLSPTPSAAEQRS
jgi:hypothetical protein